MIYDMDHHPMYIFAFCVSLGKCPANSLTHFLIEFYFYVFIFKFLLLNFDLLAYCWVLRMFLIAFIYQMCLLPIFFFQSVTCFFFHFLDSIFNFYLTLMKPSISILSFMNCVLVSFLRSHGHIGLIGFLLCYLLEVS